MMSEVAQEKRSNIHSTQVGMPRATYVPKHRQMPVFFPNVLGRRSKEIRVSGTAYVPSETPFHWNSFVSRLQIRFIRNIRQPH
jgi:hypothetical protein